MTSGDIAFLLPEIILTIGACALLVFPVIGKRGEARGAKWVMIALLAITAITVIVSSHTVTDLAQSRLPRLPVQRTHPQRLG